MTYLNLVFFKRNSILSQKVLDIIDEVQISTPEFIHGNAFMYEPLVDIEADYLFEIYNAIKKINNNEIWI